MRRRAGIEDSLNKGKNCWKRLADHILQETEVFNQTARKLQPSKKSRLQ
jgi:hypothetical protein